jgi:hypothetical protein
MIYNNYNNILLEEREMEWEDEEEDVSSYSITSWKLSYSLKTERMNLNTVGYYGGLGCCRTPFVPLCYQAIRMIE